MQKSLVLYLDNCNCNGLWKLAIGLLREISNLEKTLIVTCYFRSFNSSWGSFLILRAELEGFEELVRMGTWDFAFVISAADLPMRSVDDMAAMLAPYRG